MFVAAGTHRVPSPSGLLRLLYLGGLADHKDVHVAVEALAILRRSGLDMHLTLMGDGHSNYVRRLKQQIRRYGLNDNVHFAGPVPYSALPQRLSEFDLLIFPSLWEEPFARTPVEAMAAGILVVGSAVGGTREILEAYCPEMSVAPGDASAIAACVQRLQADSGMRQILRQRGLALVAERYDVDRMVSEIESQLISVLTAVDIP